MAEVNRVLLALEHEPGASRLLSRARSFARARRADLWVVHVIQPKKPAERAVDILEQLEEADRWLTALLRDRGRGEKPMVIIGDPAHEIAATAGIVGASAILMGAHPRSEPHGEDATSTRLRSLTTCPVVRLPALGSD